MMRRQVRVCVCVCVCVCMCVCVCGGVCVLRRKWAYVQMQTQICGHRCKDTDKARGIQVQILTQVEEGGERHCITAAGHRGSRHTHTPTPPCLPLHHYTYKY